MVNVRNFSFYRYCDMDLKTLETILDKFEDWVEKEIDPVTGQELQQELTYVKLSEKVGSFGKDALYLDFKNAKLSDKHKNNPDERKRIRRNDSEIIVFENKSDLLIVPLRGRNYTTGSLIRTALNITEDKRLLNDDLKLSEDFFYWMFNHYLNNSGQITNLNDEDKELKIISLTSFSGETRDKVNKISSDGNRISKILWTLAFLFTNEKLMSITPELKHVMSNKEGSFEEIIKLDLTLTGTYKIGINDHIGSRLMQKGTKSSIAYLILYTYEILLPKLKECYYNDIQTGSWSPHVKKQFIASIGSEISDQVNVTLKLIENTLNTEH